MKRERKVVPQLKRLFSPDADPLAEYRPNGPFGILIMAIVHPVDGQGEESFAFTVCTPDWFASHKVASQSTVVLGRHYLFVNEFSYPRLEQFVRQYCAASIGVTWEEVAIKLGRLGKWEFEDYRAEDS
jgi:hypothetical protein